MSVMLSMFTYLLGTTAHKKTAALLLAKKTTKHIEIGFSSSSCGSCFLAQPSAKGYLQFSFCVFSAATMKVDWQYQRVRCSQEFLRRRREDPETPGTAHGVRNP